ELNRAEEVGVLREAIMELKEQERVLLSLYYFEELKLHEIATILELTESRISQIRSKAIQKLRGQMGKLREQVARIRILPEWIGSASWSSRSAAWSRSGAVAHRTSRQAGS